MGLKDDIFNALIINIQPDETVENFSMTDKGIDKVETLADSLSKAIVKWVKAQTFKVTKLEASTGAAMTAPGSTVGPPSPHVIPPLKIPIITVKMNEQGQGAGNPKVGGRVESLTSEVKLKRAVEV